MSRAIPVFFLSALVLCGADVSGKWTGSLRYEGADSSRPAVLILEQEGGRLKATGGPDASRQQPFENATIEGNTIRLERRAGEADVIVIELKLENDQLAGKMTMKHGTDTRIAAVSLKKEPK
jgi:hypothetical protein